MAKKDMIKLDSEFSEMQAMRYQVLVETFGQKEADEIMGIKTPDTSFEDVIAEGEEIESVESDMDFYTEFGMKEDFE